MEIRRTADGSLTLFVPALDEHYHSTHGARQESAHVFIQHGLLPLVATGRERVHILEIGLGTGLNALLTLAVSQQMAQAITYDAFETVPLPPDVVATLADAYYPPDDPAMPDANPAFRKLHAAPWGTPFELTPVFELTKWLRPLETAPVGDPPLVEGRYDLIYFDAFAPQKQPELWTEDIFRKLFLATRPGGVLVTYCAQGQFRRDLRAAGWLTEKLPGPPGKREMTRATRPA
jgi:tRNA U34 5-methylaminomethyl-2-thiouridine-forming methyltransferase MnmC